MSSFWQRVKSGGKTGFDKAYNTIDKLGPPVNKLSNKLGSEAFWPTTLDKESDKAARILRSFCKDGFYTEVEERRPGADDGPAQKQRVLKKIPTEVIRNAKGLAIFTTMRTGLWFSGAGGAGVLIGRLEDGSWSPPSGIMLHTAGLGFLVGVDIYDCVVVINTQEGLDAFSKLRCTLGGEVAVVAGPVGAGGMLESEVHKRQAPIFTYLKSRGFYAGVQIDGTIVVERTDENERFYGERISVGEILKGKVRHPPVEVRQLLETVRAAQGDKDVDESIVPSEPPPGDLEIDDGSIFGVPEKADPDPYGVLALEKEGMGLVEAGTKKRASWQEFDFHPAPSSPIFSTYSRNSQDRDSKSTRTMSRHNSWRASAFSSMNSAATAGSHPTDSPSTSKPTTTSSLRPSMDRARPSYAESSTQTDFPPEPSGPSQGHSYRHSRTSSKESVRSNSGLSRRQSSPMQDLPENGVLTVSTGTHRNAETSTSSPAKTSTTENGYTTPPHTPPANTQGEASFHSTARPSSTHDRKPSTSPYNSSDDISAPGSDSDADSDTDSEEPTIHSIASVQTAQTAKSLQNPAQPPYQPQQHQTQHQTQQSQPPASPQRGLAAKARLVTVPKRMPPKLPVRNPNRGQAGPMVVGIGSGSADKGDQTAVQTEGESGSDLGLGRGQESAGLESGGWKQSPLDKTHDARDRRVGDGSEADRGEEGAGAGAERDSGDDGLPSEAESGEKASADARGVKSEAVTASGKEEWERVMPGGW
ncbi:hypothetical protein MBLNU230_g7672t1 [Neophaeotheca triangularis]